MKKKLLLLAATFIVTIFISAMIFGPLAARKYVNNNGKKLIGRTIHLEKIRLNYGTFTLRIIGFKLFEKNDTTVFTGFDTLLVDLEPLKFLKSELVVKRFWLINPVANITKKDTVFNFSDIIDFFSASDTTEVTDTASVQSDYKFEFSDIRLIRGKVSYTDEDINNTTPLNNLTFSIPYLSWNQKEPSRAGLKFNFRNGGYFMADGHFDPGKGDFSSKIIINNLDISEFIGYIKPYVILNTIGGLAGCNLEISGNTGLPENLAVKGRLSIDSFSATDNQNRKVIGSDSMVVSLKTSLLMQGKYVFDTISLKTPYLLFEMYDSTNNFLELLPATTVDTISAPDADSLTEPLFYSVNSFSLTDGIIDFTDKTIEEPFKYHLSRIKLNVDSVSSVSTWLTAYSTMKLNERGDLKAEIGINPADPYEMKVDYVITNFQLPDVTPYSKFYLGSAIVYGNLYYSGKTSITARQIKSDNRLIIRNAEIGKKSGGIFNIPLRLALYLIKDMNGDIKIDLPVSGDLNDPDIKLGKLIWTTFKNLIVKIAASPFIALSNLFGGDQKELQQLDFNYSDTLLSDANVRKLDQLLKIREKKPELNIELAYFNDRTREKELIAYEEAGSIFNLQTGGDYLSQTIEFEAFLRTALAKDSLDLFNDCIKLSGIEKTTAILNKRDNLRVKLIEDYLRTRDTLSGIKVFIPNAETVKNVGSKPVFEVKFSMEE